MGEIIAENDPRSIDLAVNLLRDGQLVGYPTDTVYGLGAAAGNDEAVRRLFVVKRRQPSKALPLLLADTLMASWVADVTPLAHTLMSKFWPGALTIVMRKLESYHSLALGSESTVALRIPAHSFTREMVRGLREPVTGTSANRAGAPSPVSAPEVAFQMGEMVALVVDGGVCRRGVESTVIDTIAEDGPRILREGAVSRDEIQQVLGRPVT